jgi:transcriptional regulator with XRE-family HTH domain
MIENCPRGRAEEHPTCRGYIQRSMSVDPLMAADELEQEMVELGRKIRQLRLQAGLTLKSLARTVGVSQSLISQVERGLASPSITTLRRLAGALGVPIAALFLGDEGASSGETDTLGRRLVVRRGERKRLHVPRSKVGYELLTPDLKRRIEFLWIEYEPGSATHPAPMAHAGEENAVCLEGSVIVTIDGQEFVLTEGDSISFDSGRPHQVENRTENRAVLVSAITPPAF